MKHIKHGVEVAHDVHAKRTTVNQKNTPNRFMYYFYIIFCAFSPLLTVSCRHTVGNIGRE